MHNLAALPTYRERYERRADFEIEAGSIYVYGESVEKRSHLPKGWIDKHPHAVFVKVEEEPYAQFAFVVNATRYNLRSRRDLQAFVSGLAPAGARVYLDITGLSHHVWAPLVGAMMDLLASTSAFALKIVYVEPGHYAKAQVPRPGEIFALSLETRGVRPLPGFARLRRVTPESSVLIALLGFEGFRFHAVIANLEPDSVEVIPVVGVPGFRAEYPFYTFEGNQFPLVVEDNWGRREFVTANDPFEVVRLLSLLQSRQPEALLRVAMVGTKPHALGAVIYFKLYPDMCELIYDNPIRSPGRTESDRRVLVYDLSAFVEVWQQ